MKKLFIAAIAVFAFSASNAQDVKFGAKLGLNLATISGPSGYTTKPGFNLGGFAEIKISEEFAVQPELLFSTQGAKFKDDSSVSTNLNYINIPVMAKYFVTKEISLEAGPQVGFLLSANVKDSSNSLDIKDQSSTVDFGFGLGGGYEITENISVGLRYVVGLSKINKESFTGSTDAKNAVFQLGVAYKF